MQCILRPESSAGTPRTSRLARSRRLLPAGGRAWSGRLRSVVALGPPLVAVALVVGASAPSQMAGVNGTATMAASTAPILIGENSGYTFPADIDSYTNLVGAKPHFVMWCQSWDEPLFYSSQVAGIAARGATPLITWSPGSNFAMPDLLAGNYDSYIVAQAKLARSWQQPLFVRLFHEMNGNWQSFGPGHTTSAQFVQGWQRVVALFRAQGVTNVSWVWSPNLDGFGPSTVAFRPLYPGDSYVDWVGLDGYNFGNPWRDWSTLYRGSYDDITSLTAKPLMVAEWGSTEVGGDKAAWIADAFQTQIPVNMPRIRAVIAWNLVAESDFRVNSSPAALAAYRKVVNSAQYGGAAPVDSTSPTLSFTSPADRATVSGVVPVSVRAADDVAVASVSVALDGAVLGTRTVEPYDFNVNTFGVAAGVHTLTAAATDAAGNQAGTSIVVRVENAAPATPDLVVTDLTWAPARPIAGQSVTFTATVKNQGMAATPIGTTIGVAFLVDGRKVSWSGSDASSLPAGQSRALSADGGPTGTALWPATVGTHAVRAVVDDVFRIAESNEGNNGRDSSLIVATRRYR
jgi:Glycosyl hydrolase family 26/Bacterial Ig domain/CARDB